MCGIVGIINVDGHQISGQKVVEAIKLQKDRGNGLGAGFVGYGIHPDRPDEYALYVMFEKGKYTPSSHKHPNIARVEEWMGQRLRINHTEEVPIDPKRQRTVVFGPFFKRYFCYPLDNEFSAGLSEEQAMRKFIMEMNVMEGIFVLSCGKNMGVFKGVGCPEDIAKFFRLETYEGWMWIAHDRTATNTPNSWFGAHPFTILGTAVVHNGEVTSYGTNVNWLEQHQYPCTMETDTEVIAYIYDKLKQDGLSDEEACQVMAPPTWKEIERIGYDRMKKLRQFYGGALIDGPFAIIIADERGAIALCDRKKLRPLVIGHSGNTWGISSEECSFSTIWSGSKNVEIIRPDGGQAVIIKKGEQG